MVQNPIETHERMGLFGLVNCQSQPDPTPSFVGL